VARLESKHKRLKRAIGADASGMMTLPRPQSVVTKVHKQRRVGKAPIVGQPKVFGCSLEEYIEVSKAFWALQAPKLC